MDHIIDRESERPPASKMDICVFFFQANLGKEGLSSETPEATFERAYMKLYNLKYDSTLIKEMHKNGKSCIQKIYISKFSVWRQSMMAAIKYKTGITVTVTQPKYLQVKGKRFRRGTVMYWIGRLKENKVVEWQEVSKTR